MSCFLPRNAIAITGCGAATEALASVDSATTRVSTQRQGSKYLSPATRCVLEAAKLAMHDATLGAEMYADHRKGTVVGTNFADAAVRADMDNIVLQSSAKALSAAAAPNSSVNLPASYLAIEQRCRAFSLTLTNPTVAGLEAVLIGCRALERQQASMVIAAAAEDCKPEPGKRPRSLRAAPRGASASAFTLESLSGAGPRSEGRLCVVGGVLTFVPPSALDIQTDRLAAALASELVRMLGSCPTPHSLFGVRSESAVQHFVDDVLMGVLRRHSAQPRDSRSPLTEAAGTLPAVHGVSAAVAAAEPSWIVATSSYGHVALLCLGRVLASRSHLNN